MFERYTEKARRTIFFARYEASQTASTTIEAGHILLGLLREDRALAKAFVTNEEAFFNSIRHDLRALAGGREKTPGTIDMPLSPKAKKVLTQAVQACERLRDRHVDTAHLLLGLLEVEGTSVSEALLRQGITSQKVEVYLKEGAVAVSTALPGGDDLRNKDGAVADMALMEEMAAQVMNKAGLTEMKESFYLLLELLAQKGVITQEEKDKLAGHNR